MEKKVYTLNKEETKEFLHKVKSDEKIKYVKIKGRIHDKTCGDLNSVPKEYFELLNEYDNTLCQCQNCAMKSYIRYGVRDFNNVDKYEAIFKKFHLYPDNLRKIFIEEGLKVEYLNDTFYVSSKTDKFKIVFGKNSKNEDITYLYHNNYIMNKGEREFVGGYHKQFDCSLPLISSFKNIWEYTYENHLKGEAKKKEISNPDYITVTINEYKYINEEYIEQQPSQFNKFVELSNMVEEVYTLLDAHKVSLEDINNYLKIKEKYNNVNEKDRE